MQTYKAAQLSLVVNLTLTPARARFNIMYFIRALLLIDKDAKCGDVICCLICAGSSLFPAEETPVKMKMFSQSLV